MAVGRLRRLDHRLPRGGFVPEADVFQNRLAEEPVVLLHKADLRHERIQRQVANVHAADGDLPFAHIPKPGDQRGDRALAAAGGADNGRDRSGRGGEGDAGERARAVRLIGEENIREFQRRGSRCGAVRALRQIRLGHHFVQPLHLGIHAHEFLHDAPDLRDHGGDGRRENQIKQKPRRKVLPLRRVRRGQERRRNQKQIGVSDQREKPRHMLFPVSRVGNHHVCVVPDGVLQFPERADAAAEGFEHRHAAHAFHGGVFHLIERIIVELHHVLCAAAAHREVVKHIGDRNAEGHREPEAPVDREHQRDHRHRIDHGGDHIRQLVGDEALDLLRARAHQMKLLSRALRHVPAERQPRELSGERKPQIIRRLKRGDVREHEGGEIGQHIDRRAEKGNHAEAEHTAALRCAGQKGLQQQPDRQIRHEIGKRRDHREQDRSGHAQRLLKGDRENPPNDSKAGLCLHAKHLPVRFDEPNISYVFPERNLGRGISIRRKFPKINRFRAAK